MKIKQSTLAPGDRRFISLFYKMMVSVFRAVKTMRGSRNFATRNGKDLYFPKYGCSFYEYQDDPVVKNKFLTAELTTDEGPKKAINSVTSVPNSTDEGAKKIAFLELIDNLEDRIEYEEEFGWTHPPNVKRREEEARARKTTWKAPVECPYGGRED